MRSLLAILTGAIVARISVFVIGTAVVLTIGPPAFRGVLGPALMIVSAGLVGGLAAGAISRRDEIGHAAFAGLLYAVSIGWPARYLLAQHHPMLVLLAFLLILVLAGTGGALIRLGRSGDDPPAPATEPASRPVASFLGLPPRSLFALGLGFAVADALALAIFLGSRVLLGRFLDGDPPDVRFLHASVAVRHAAAPFGALVGGWLTARLAPARRFGHAAALGVAIAVTSLIGLLAFFHRVPGLDRRLLILILPVLTAILGGALARPRTEAT